MRYVATIGLSTLLIGLGIAVVAMERPSSGVQAYDDGRFEDAHAAFIDEDEQSSSAESALNRALAALQVGDLDDAAVAAERARSTLDAELAGWAEFLLASVEFERAKAAAEQATAAEAEPFAFDVALGRAEAAREGWIAAAIRRADWPAARRNVERATALLENLRRRKAEAENRPNKTEPDKPKPAPGAAQLDPTEDDESPDEGTDQTGTAAPVLTTLSADEVRSLLDVLAAREREKRAMRTEQRRERSTDVENDW